MHRRWGTTLGLATAALVALTACAQPAAEAGDDPAEETVTLEVGVVPVVDIAVLYLGIEQGYFEDEGIELNINTGNSGAEIIAAVASGQYDFAFTAVPLALQFREKGQPVTIIAPGTASTGIPGKDVHHIQVRDGIERPKDLEGKKVTLNARGGLAEMLGSLAVSDDGGDPSLVEWVELPFAQGYTALQNGDVDAMVGPEPFSTALQEEGFASISSPYQILAPEHSLVTSVWYTMQTQIDERPELFERLQHALTRSLEYAGANPEEVRRITPSFSGLSEEQVANIVLPNIKPDFPVGDIDDIWSPALVEFGLLETPIAYDEVVWDQVPR
ncbi:ABC transporter substrate-binding protein [Microbacterium sp. 18062]|uniref:ABC transporter substrate-binding protein n=1 Tax=Microbacterium sp. 18062 TaxID=2681410 RepID=UPI001F30CA4B|nr:ABC transporter substrate-binding protein [Microbacterium sp. 18062]